MTTLYRIAGWMIDAQQGISLSHWKTMFDRLNPTLNYVPFEVGTESLKIVGMIDQVLKEEHEEEFQQLTEDWLRLCLSQPQYLEKSEWTIFGETACVESLCQQGNPEQQLHQVQTFKEFAMICDWRLTFHPLTDERYQANLWRPNQTSILLPRTYSEVDKLFIEIEDIAREMAKDLMEYSKGHFNGRPGKSRTDLLYAVRQYQQFATKDEVEALIRLIEID